MTATTQTSRLGRAQVLVAQGRVSQTRRESTTYHVSALDNHHAYTVRLEGPSLCSCPDHAYRRVRCKHFLAATLIHLAASAAPESGVRTLRRAAPRGGRPIWYEAAAETHPLCADCGRSDCRGSYKPDGNHGLVF